MLNLARSRVGTAFIGSVADHINFDVVVDAARVRLIRRGTLCRQALPLFEILFHLMSLDSAWPRMARAVAAYSTMLRVAPRLAQAPIAGEEPAPNIFTPLRAFPPLGDFIASLHTQQYREGDISYKLIVGQTASCELFDRFSDLCHTLHNNHGDLETYNGILNQYRSTISDITNVDFNLRPDQTMDEISNTIVDLAAIIEVYSEGANTNPAAIEQKKRDLVLRLRACANLQHIALALGPAAHGLLIGFDWRTR